MILLYSVFYEDVKDYIAMSQIIVTSLAILVRNLVIATKWAYMSDAVIESFFHLTNLAQDIDRLRTDPLDPERDIKFRQIGSGWLVPGNVAIIKV